MELLRADVGGLDVLVAKLSISYRPFFLSKLSLTPRKVDRSFARASSIHFDKKKGRYEIESFGNQYIKATNVRPQ